jgi:hypothetical protein
MLLLRPSIILTAALTLASLDVSAASLDQRDPAYQSSIESLATGRQALAYGLQMIEEANAIYAQPGLDVELIKEQYAPLLNTLDLILVPEQRRRESKVIVPDAMFFKKPAVGPNGSYFKPNP